MIVHDKSTIDAHFSELMKALAVGPVCVEITQIKARTPTQNNSIHKYCEMLSTKFNEAGLDMNQVLAEGASIPWSPSKVKDDIWRKVQIATLGKESTKDLSTTEVSQVYEIINRHISQTFGVHVPFPSKENLEG